jgi:hypothetical protein
MRRDTAESGLADVSFIYVRMLGEVCEARGPGSLAFRAAFRFVDSASDKAKPSARSVRSPSLLTCLHDFAHVPCWPNLENVAVFHGRTLRHELYSMIHVPRRGGRALQQLRL